MSDLKTKKTELQKEFEAQTPTIKGIYGNEYNIVYCAWLEFQVEKLRKANDLKTSASGLHLQNVTISSLRGFLVDDKVKCTYNSSGNKFWSEMLEKHPKIEGIRQNKHIHVSEIKLKGQWFYESDFVRV